MQAPPKPGVGAQPTAARPAARASSGPWGSTPADGLKFALTGAYVDAYLTENAPAAGANDGDRLPYAPKWSGSLDGSYTWRIFRDVNVSAGATWSCIGSRTSVYSATTEVVGGAVVAIPNPRAELPSYDTVNLLGLDNPTGCSAPGIRSW